MTKVHNIKEWRAKRAVIHAKILEDARNGVNREQLLSEYNSAMIDISPLHPKHHKRQSLSQVEQEST